MGSFTSLGLLEYDYFTYRLNDTIANPGDKIKINIYLKYNGSISEAPDVEASVSCTDAMVQVLSEQLSFGSISPGMSKSHNYSCYINIHEDYSDTLIILNLDISSEGYSFWKDTMHIRVYDPSVIFNHSGNASVRLYPNPTEEIINIEMDDPADAKLEIYNITGRSILRKNIRSTKESIDMSGYPKGIYLVKVNHGGMVNVGKVVVR